MWKVFAGNLDTVDLISALSDNGNIVTLYCIISMWTSFACSMKSCKLLSDHLLKHAELKFPHQNNTLPQQHIQSPWLHKDIFKNLNGKDSHLFLCSYLQHTVITLGNRPILLKCRFIFNHSLHWKTIVASYITAWHNTT